MSTNIWDAISGVSNAVGSIWGKKESGQADVKPTKYQAEVTGTSTYTQRQSSNIMLYAGLGGVGLLMLMFLMKK